MNLNPFGFGVSYWNNWAQEDDHEFVLLSMRVELDDGVFMLAMGAVGFGFVFAWKLPLE